MQHFKKITMEAPLGKQNAVIMGRKTWESIPPKFRPLEGRTNLVLTRSNDATVLEEGVLLASSLQQAQQTLEQLPHIHNIFVIGGAQIYQQALEQPNDFVHKVIYTEVSNIPPDAKFDAFFPELDPEEWRVEPYSDKENGQLYTDAKSGIQYRFLEYTRLPLNTEEMQYLNLCHEILETGVHRGDRTGTGTISKFGTQMRFSLRDGTLPLLTTKRTFWRGLAEELLWFISVRAYFMNRTNIPSHHPDSHFLQTGQHERE